MHFLYGNESFVLEIKYYYVIVLHYWIWVAMSCHFSRINYVPTAVVIEFHLLHTAFFISNSVHWIICNNNEPLIIAPVDKLTFIFKMHWIFCIFMEFSLVKSMGLSFCNPKLLVIKNMKLWTWIIIRHESLTRSNF